MARKGGSPDIAKHKAESNAALPVVPVMPGEGLPGKGGGPSPPGPNLPAIIQQQSELLERVNQANIALTQRLSDLDNDNRQLQERMVAELNKFTGAQKESTEIMQACKAAASSSSTPVETAAQSNGCR